MFKAGLVYNNNSSEQKGEEGVNYFCIKSLAKFTHCICNTLTNGGENRSTHPFRNLFILKLLGIYYF